MKINACHAQKLRATLLCLNCQLPGTKIEMKELKVAFFREPAKFYLEKIGLEDLNSGST